MVIWLALVIPILGIGGLVWKFHHKLVWWEILIMVTIPIVLVAGSKALIESAQTTDTEYWGGWAVQAEYYEDWNERVPCRHPIPCSHPQYDSEGHFTGYAHFNDGYYHAYDVDYHPPYWEIDDSNGFSIRITQGFFGELVKRWGNKKFVDLHRDYHDNDGDKYVTSWDGKPESLEATTTTHSYENRVAVSDSVFNYPDIENPEELGLYEYPPVRGHRQETVLGGGTAAAERKFSYINATLGAKKQVRIFVLVFRGQPLQVAVGQESYWKGGNKNELVSCVGVDVDQNVQWAYVFSWSKSEVLKIEARDFLAGQKTLDLEAYADWLGPAVEKQWTRLEFAEFAYLTVEPPWWAVLIVFILTIVATVISGLICIRNDVDPGSGLRYRDRWRMNRLRF